MKTLALSLAAVAALALPAMGHAQTLSASASATVTVKVQPFVAAAKVDGRDLKFGNIDRTGVAVDINQENAALVKVDFNKNSTVTLTLPATLALVANATTSANSYALPISYTCASKSTATGTFTAATCVSGATLGVSLTSNKMTSNWIGIGGSITAADADEAPAGEYTGTITVHIATTAS